MSLASRFGAFLLGEGPSEEDDHHISFDDDPFMWTLFVCVCLMLVCMAGLMSGLTLGLMGLDSVELEVLKRTGTEEEKRYAAIIMPVRAGIETFMH